MPAPGNACEPGMFGWVEFVGWSRRRDPTTPATTEALRPGGAHGTLGLARSARSTQLTKSYEERHTPYSCTRRSRSALPTTLTEESAMAAAATIGDSRMPNSG